MTMSVDIHHLAAAYSLDALDPQERAAFEAHYASCEVCSRDVGDFRATLTTLAELSKLPPPADLKANVMHQIGAIRQLSPLLPETIVDLASRRRTVRGSLLAAAAALLLVVTGAAFLAGRSSTSTNAFTAELARVLTRPDARVLDLGAASNAVTGHLRVVWSPSEQRAEVIGDGLLPPGQGKVYELWLIGDSGPVPARLLDSASNGVIRRSLSINGAPNQWGVTIEPRQGSAAPTGDILFLGSV
jgi:anti-sigma-K factor RskA